MDSYSILEMIVRQISERPHVSLVRLWLIRPGDSCSSCPSNHNCLDQSQCLHLVRSRGTIAPENELNLIHLDSQCRRIPLAHRDLEYLTPASEPKEIIKMLRATETLTTGDWGRKAGIG